MAGGMRLSWPVIFAVEYLPASSWPTPSELLQRFVFSGCRSVTGPGSVESKLRCRVSIWSMLSSGRESPAATAASYFWLAGNLKMTSVEITFELPPHGLGLHSPYHCIRSSRSEHTRLCSGRSYHISHMWQALQDALLRL